jgi:hypothetical protein
MPNPYPLKEKIRGALLVLFGILFVWLIAEGDLLESLSTEGWNGRSVSDLMKQALPTLLLVALAILAVSLLANFDRLLHVVFHLVSVAAGQPGEDKRLTEYRKQVRLENSVGSLRVFCGFLGLAVLFILSMMAILIGTEGGLFTGGLLASLVRFGKFAFFLSCLWGLLAPWRDYSDENGKQCSRRREMLAQIEQDPDWWNKHDEEQRRRDERNRQWKKEQEELEAKLASMGIHPAPDRSQKAPHESLADLTRQLQGAKRETKP